MTILSFVQCCSVMKRYIHSQSVVFFGMHVWLLTFNYSWCLYILAPIGRPTRVGLQTLHLYNVKSSQVQQAPLTPWPLTLHTIWPPCSILHLISSSNNLQQTQHQEPETPSQSLTQTLECVFPAHLLLHTLSHEQHNLHLYQEDCGKSWTTSHYTNRLIRKKRLNTCYE